MKKFKTKEEWLQTLTEIQDDLGVNNEDYLEVIIKLFNMDTEDYTKKVNPTNEIKNFENYMNALEILEIKMNELKEKK